jgi:amylosucrase
MLNDYGYINVPEHAADNRWMHRPRMDWEKASKRHEKDRLESRIFEGVQSIIQARKRTPHLHASIRSEILETLHPHIFAYVRRHPLGNLLCLYNFTESEQFFRSHWLRDHLIYSPYDMLTETFVDVIADHVNLQPYQTLWLLDKQ